MEFKKLNEKIIKGWRISRVIRLILFLMIAILGNLLLNSFVDDGMTINLVVGIILWLLPAYALVGLILYPPIKYRQWGYYIDDEKVVIRHGIFFINQTIIPIIRIQNITISQGPINRRLGLYKMEISLASGSHEIVGLDQETSDFISDSLRAKLYQRMEVKGEV